MVTRSSKTDVVGKVFLYVSPDERRCLICLQVFSRLESLEHSRESCESVASTGHIPEFLGILGSVCFRA
jgi:hypothetical protein